MTSAVADLFVSLRAETAPLVAGFTEAGAAGERMAAQIKAAMAEVEASVTRITEATRAVVTAASEMSTAWDADMTKMKTSTASLGAEATAPLKTAFTEVGASADKMAAQVSAAMKDVEASVAKTAESTKSVTAAGSEMATAWDADIAKMKTATTGLAAGVDAEAAKVKTAAAEVGAATEGAAAKTATASAGIGNSWKLMGVGVAAGVYEAVKAAGDFQQAGTRLVTSAGENAQVLNSTVKPAILGMAQTYGVSAQQIIKAMYDVNSAGYTGAAGLGVMNAAVQGSIMEQADLKTAVGAVTTALVDYYPKMSDAGQISQTSADLVQKFIAATKDGRMTLEQLVSGLHNVAPAAAQMHISLEQVLAILATMTQHGMTVEQATDNMNHAFLKFAGDGTAQMKAGLAAIGIQWQDLQKTIQSKGIVAAFEEIDQAARAHLGPNGQQVIIQWKQAIQGATPAVQELAAQLATGTMSFKDYRKAMNDLPPAEKQQASELLNLFTSTHDLGNEHVKNSEIVKTYAGAIKSATGDMTTYKVITQTTGEYTDRLNKALRDVLGATADADGKVKGINESMSNFNNQANRVKTAIEVLGITIGNSLLGPLTTLASKTADVINWFSKHETAASALAKVLEGVLAVAILGLADKGVKAFAKLAAELPKDLIKMGAWALEKAGLYKKAGDAAESEATTETSAAQRATTAIQELATATEEAAARIKAAYAEIGAAAETSSAQVVEADAAASAAAEGEALATGGGALAGAEGAALARRGETGRRAGRGALLGGAGLLGAFAGGQVLESTTSPGPTDKPFSQWSTGQKLSDAGNTAGNVLSLDIPALVDKFKRDIQNLPQDLQTAGGRLKTAWNDLLTPIKNFWSQADQLTKTGFSQIGSAFSTGWNAVKTATSTAWDAIKTVLTTAWTSITSAAQTAWNGLSGFFSGLWNGISNTAKTAWNGISSFFSSLWSTITSALTTAWNGVATFFAGLWNTISSAAKTAWNAFSTFLSNLWNTITSGVQTAWNGIVTFFSNTWNTITATAQTAWNSFTTFLSNLWNTITSGVQTAWNNIVSFFGQIPGRIQSAVGNLGSVLTNAGTAAMQGFYNAMVNFYNSYIKPWLSSLASYIASLKGPVDKDRQLLVPHGKAMMAGLQEGLRTGFADVLKDVGQYGAQIQVAMGNGSGSAYSAYSRGGGGGDRDDRGGGDMHFTFNGHVWDIDDLIRQIQEMLCRHNIRNPNNATVYATDVVRSTLSAPVHGPC